MFGTPENVLEIVLIEESPRSPVISSTLKRGSLMIRSPKSGSEVLTLRWDGSRLQIWSPCTWTSGSQVVWSGGSLGPLEWESQSTYDTLRPIEQNKSSDTKESELSKHESDQD